MRCGSHDASSFRRNDYSIFSWFFPERFHQSVRTVKKCTDFYRFVNPRQPWKPSFPTAERKRLDGARMRPVLNAAGADPCKAQANRKIHALSGFWGGKALVSAKWSGSVFQFGAGFERVAPVQQLLPMSHFGASSSGPDHWMGARSGLQLRALIVSSADLTRSHRIGVFPCK